VSLVVEGLVIAGGIVLGRWIARAVKTRGARRAPALPVATGDATEAPVELPASFPCKLGDVVVRVAERDEAWLAGALVFSEDRPTAALFVAPEAGTDRALFVRDVPGTGVVWLAPLAAGELPLTKDPPHALEHGGTRFERSRRLPVRVSRLGSGAPPVGDRAVVAEYTGPASERLVVVAGSDATWAWRGALLGEGEYDVLPGSKETREG
jgi:hypothetical protein